MTKLTIIEPVVTEKSLKLVKKGYYTFRVVPDAHKAQISESVGKIFAVDAVSVQTISMHGKTKRAGRMRKEVKRSNWKKAVVKIKKGQKIDVFSITPEEEDKKNEKPKK